MRFMLASVVLLIATAAQALEERVPIVRAAVLEAPRGGETRFLLDMEAGRGCREDGGAAAAAAK